MNARGFTLIELLVTLALAAIMLTLAAPSMQQMLANQRLSASASDMMTSVMQARSTALKNNQRVIVQPSDGSSSTPGDWKNGWRIYVDTDQDSTFTTGTDTLVLTVEPPPTGIGIAKVTGVNNFLGYDGSGFLASIGGSTNATWLISSPGTTDRKKYLIIERSGRARLCDKSILEDC